MKSMSGDTNSKTRPLARDIGMVLLGTALILLVPLVAMQLTAEVNWSLFDFVLMGALIATTGLMFVLVARNVPNSGYRMLAGIALALALLLIWAELAVGVFGSPFAGS